MYEKFVEQEWLYAKDWYKPGLYEVSHFNFCKAVKERMPNLPKKVLPTDTTLREGVEMSGVHLDTEGYLEVAQRLADVGIKETDCGYAGHPEPLKAVRRISDAGVKISTRLITRFPSMEQIDAAADAGANVIKLQTGTGALWRMKYSNPEYYKLWKTKQVIPQTIKKIKHIEENYPDVLIQLGLTGTSTHESIDNLKEICKAAVDAGAHRVSLSLSRGVEHPLTAQYMAEEIRSVIGGADLQCHCHNDFGMATALAMGWVQGGGTSFDCTINGLGDRAGNSPMEECVVALELLYGVDTGVKIDKLYDLCTWWEKKSGIRMTRTKAITGPGAFLEESHLGGKLNAEKLGVTDDWYIGVSPKVFGREHECIWGSTNLLPHIIIQKLDNMGLSYTDKQVEEIGRRGWDIINTKLKEQGSGEAWVTMSEFENIIKDVLKK